ncbi:hypothetical protein KJ840_02305 [Patescibacteria group bacterium]|nr:hypothetical protein [Patescibacteria group bacterium]
MELSENQKEQIGNGQYHITEGVGAPEVQIKTSKNQSKPSEGQKQKEKKNGKAHKPRKKST